MTMWREAWRHGEAATLASSDALNRRLRLAA